MRIIIIIIWDLLLLAFHLEKLEERSLGSDVFAGKQVLKEKMPKVVI